jgi:hypothetical protein
VIARHKIASRMIELGVWNETQKSHSQITQ